METVTIQKLSKTYPSGKEALKQLSLTLSTGEVFGFLGPNGAGKTTTVKLLTGVLSPSGGSCEINTSLLLCYNPAQVLKMGGKHYLTGPVILARTNMDGEVVSLTIDEVYLFQKYLANHSITLMADDQKLPCICID